MAHTYVIAAAPDRHKIGISSSPKGRLQALQTAHHTTLRLAYTLEARDAAAVEALAHKLLRAHRLRGEWFAVAEDQAVAAVQLAHRSLERPHPTFFPGQRLMCLSAGAVPLRGDRLEPGRPYVVERVGPTGHLDLVGVRAEGSFSALCFDPWPVAGMAYGVQLACRAANTPQYDVGIVV